MLPDGGIYDPESGLSFNDTVMVTNRPRTTTRTATTIKPTTTIDGYDITSPSVTPVVTTPTTTKPVTSTTTVTPTVTPTVTSTVTSTVTEKRNAREFLIAALRPYFASASDAGFLKDLEGIIDDYIKQDYDADTISVLLPQTKPYQERFKGNVARAAAGLSQLSPAEYIQAEEQYNEILKRFNLGSLASRDTFANLISGQVSAAELTDRVVNVYDRIRNADPALKSELDRVKELSAGQLSEADFAKALLTGETGANELKRKITVAEIGAEARTRGLETTRAQQLEQLGVTREQARAGFEQIGLTQPRLTQLSEFYTGTTPDASGLQEELEREQFQGMQSQRRRRLAEQEQTAFMGQSGTAGAASLARRRTGSI